MQAVQVAKNEKEKECSKCLIETDFQSRMRAEGTKQCKICRCRNTKYNNNPTSAQQKRINLYLAHKKNEIEKSRGCQWPNGCRFNFSDKLLCDENKTFAVCDEIENMVIFEFDHIEEKLFCVSEWVYGSREEQELLDEMSKCRILCRFHHQIHSNDQRNEKKKNKVYSDTKDAIRSRKRKRENAKKLKKLKLDTERFGKCVLCEYPVLEGETTGFDFDHIDPHGKHSGISYLVRIGYSWEHSILPEIGKCRLLCANCHALHTQEQKKPGIQKNIYRNKLPQNKEEMEIAEKGTRPTKNELVLKYSFVDVGKRYGVTDMTIIRWCKNEGIPHKRRKLMDSCVLNNNDHGEGESPLPSSLLKTLPMEGKF